MPASSAASASRQPVPSTAAAAARSAAAVGRVRKASRDVGGEVARRGQRALEVAPRVRRHLVEQGQRPAQVALGVLPQPAHGSARELGGKLLQLVAADGLEMEPVAGAALGEPLDAVELCARACCDDGQDGARGSAQRVDDRVHGLGVGPLRVVEDERDRRVAFEHV